MGIYLTGYTTAQVATILGVDPSRVRQLQLAMRMSGVKRQGSVLIFGLRHIERMRKRNTKPGPKQKKGNRNANKQR